MFGKREKIDQEIHDQIDKLWTCHNDLAELVKNITELMRQVAEGMQINRDDFDHLALQTLKIAEQQNKLISHVMRSEDIVAERVGSPSLH